MSGFAAVMSGIWHFSQSRNFGIAETRRRIKKYSTLIDYDFYD
jgi:hypothetical protein